MSKNPLHSLQEMEQLVEQLRTPAWKEANQRLLAIGPEAIGLLRQAVSDADPQMRSRVVTLLGLIGGSRAVAALIGALGDSHRSIRSRAAWGLARLSPLSLPPLIQALGSSDPYVSCWAGMALIRIGPPAIKSLSEALKEVDPVGRGKGKACGFSWSEMESARRTVLRAVRVLGYIGDPGAIDLLIGLLGKTGVGWYDVPGRSAIALGKIGEPAVEPLVRALKAPSPWYLRLLDCEVSRWCASLALSLTGGAGTRALIRCLEDPDSKVRSLAALRLGEARAVPAVRALVLALTDKNSGVRQSAVGALGKIGDSSALQPLLIALELGDREMRLGAASALGAIGDVRALPGLIHALESRDSSLRVSAVAALGELGSTDALPSLIHALRDRRFEVRCLAASALGAIGDPRAIEPLSRLLNDKVPIVAHTAERALSRLRQGMGMEPTLVIPAQPGARISTSRPASRDSSGGAKK